MFLESSRLSSRVVGQVAAIAVGSTKLTVGLLATELGQDALGSVGASGGGPAALHAHFGCPSRRPSGGSREAAWAPWA